MVKEIRIENAENLKNGSPRKQIWIPILPEEITIDDGSATFATCEIMELGEVAVPTGTALTTYSWESEFPGSLRKNDPLIKFPSWSGQTWMEPKEYSKILENWRINKTKLTLIVSGIYYLNKDVYLKEYTPKFSGPFGDISYKLVFVEARNVTIKATTDEGGKRPSSGGKSYTIKSGDSLWKIAQKYYGAGSKWKTIYNANKDIIESTAKKHGKKSSDNGHWIYPGVTITIP